jgi:trimeric autotransporter adhesin
MIMKKLYFLVLLCCSCIYAQAQVSIATIYASGTSGSYTTGNATSGARTDGNIVSTAATQRGYAVFDLSAIPAGALIGSVTIGFYTSTYGGSGAPSGWDTYGYPGDLSTVTLAGTLFADMVAGTSLSTATYGTGVGVQTLASTASMVSFVQANIGGKVSVCWTGGSSRIYTITGETGTTTTTGVHAPYIQINYCTLPSAVTASLNPTAVCAGDSVFLSGSATGANTYIWTGPAGFISTSTTALDTFFTSSLSSIGTYTLSAVNSCGTFATTVNATTAALAVNPLPSAISGTSTICTGNATTLTDPTVPGTWTSSDPSIVSVGLTSGLITGSSSGLAIITYTTTTGGTSCYVTHAVIDNNPPTPISGATNVCVGSSIVLFDTYGGGTWTESSGTGSATIDAAAGIVGGSTSGTVNITYTITGCLPVYYSMSVDPLPANILPSAAASVCVGSTITLTDATPLGSWMSADITKALVSSSGVVTGSGAGTVNIDYILSGTGCTATKSVVVNPLPAAIAGTGEVCVGNGLTLSDGSSPGTFTSTGTYAIVTGTGALTGILPGIETITYTLATTCATTATVTVDAVPSAITGVTTICQNTTTTLSDTDPGGAWSSTATGVATVGSSSGDLAGVTAGSAIVSYTFGTGCAAAVAVSINPAPAATITAGGPTTFCAGGTVVLNANAGAGLTYQWDDGLGYISGATDITYTASTTDNFSVEVTNADNCTTVSSPTAVTAGINAILVYSTSPSFCIGGNVLLDVNTGGAVGTITYQWQKNGTNILGAVSNTYDATSSGIYSCNVVIVGSSGSCSITSTTTTVSENNLPTPSVSYSGGVLSTSSGYVAYQWYRNTVSVAGANSYRYTPTATASYFVEVTDANGCTGRSSAIAVNELAVPVLTADEVQIFPNPATNTVNIEAPAAVRSVISDVSGKNLIETNEPSINVSRLAPGMYIIALYDTNGVRVKVEKLVKE